MRAKIVPVFTLLATAGILIWAGAQAATTEGRFADPSSAAVATPPGSIQLAGSANKLGDKYLAGKAGGRYGIGGTAHSKAKGSKSKAKDGSKGDAKDGNKGDGTSLRAKPAP